MSLRISASIKGVTEEALQSKVWDTSHINLVSDITAIPAPDASFDVVLCSDVLEHMPELAHALDGFVRPLKPGGKLFLTAPFASLVHMSWCHFCSGFSRYWCEHRLTQLKLRIETLVTNGDQYATLRQEVTRLGGIECQRGKRAWPLV